MNEGSMALVTWKATIRINETAINYEFAFKRSRSSTLIFDLSRFSLTGVLEDHLASLLVRAQAGEDGMAEPSILCPFGEVYFRHQLGLDPMRSP